MNYSGILCVYKPRGISSFAVIANLRKITGIKKIGHAGTLDPIAEGMLVVAIGSATRLLEFLVTDEKSYIATMHLGAESTTYDSEGEVTVIGTMIPEMTHIEEVLAKYRGHIVQTPPAFSAIKINGERAYKRARAGEDVEMPTREVFVKQLELKSYEYPVLSFTSTVSSGTYIRSIIHDIGNDLGTGAYMTALVRTHVGVFNEKDMVPLEELTPENIGQYIKELTPGLFPELPTYEMSEEEVGDIRNGKKIPTTVIDGKYQLVFQGKTCGVAVVEEGILKPKKLLS